QAHAAARPAQGAVGWDLVGQTARRQLVDKVVEAVVADLAEEAPVHGQARGLATQGNALDFLDGEPSVGGGGTSLDAELLLGVFEELVAAVEQARDVRADGDQMPAGRLEEQHVVEAGRAQDLGGSELEELTDVLHGLGRDPAV